MENLNGLKKYFILVLVLTALAAMVIWPEEIKNGVAVSFSHVTSTIIPSLFPFLALCYFTLYSGAAEALGKIFGFIPRYVFRLPKYTFSTLLLGLLGGYPAGASGIAAMLRAGRLTEKQAASMLCFCVNPGFAFVVSFVGVSVLNDLHTAGLMLFSVLFSSVLIGFFVSLFRPVPENNVQDAASSQSSALIKSALSASESLVRIGSCVLLFSFFTSALNESGAIRVAARLFAPTGLSPEQGAAFLNALLEIVSGTSLSAQSGLNPIFLTFALAFGGICVHIQIFSCFETFPMSKLLFLFFKFLHGALSSAVFLVTARFSGSPLEVFASSVNVFPRPELTMNIAGGTALLFMSVFLLISLKRDCTETKSVIE